MCSQTLDASIASHVEVLALANRLGFCEGIEGPDRAQDKGQPNIPEKGASRFLEYQGKRPEPAPEATVAPFPERGAA